MKEFLQSTYRMSAWLFFVGLLGGCGGGNGQDGDPQDPKEKNDWTVLVYMAADNELGLPPELAEPGELSAALSDMNEMEDVGSTESVDIIVQIDLPEGQDWTNCRRYRIESDSDRTTVNSPVLKDLDECDMSQSSTLRSFLRWGVNEYPADRYLVVLWGHGEAWLQEVQPSSIFNDWSGDPDAFMPNYVLRQALQGAGIRPDILAFDACVMGSFEVAYELRGRADIMVSSQDEVHIDGYPYDDILRDLIGAPDLSAQELAQTIVTRYEEYYIGKPNLRLVCLSALRMSGVNLIADAANDLAGTLTGGIQDQGFFDSLSVVREESETFTNSWERYVDLRDLAMELRIQMGLDTEALESAVDAAVIENFQREGHPHASGLSVYFPKTKFWYEWDPTYDSGNPSAFMDLDWDEFLEAYFSLLP